MAATTSQSLREQLERIARAIKKAERSKFSPQYFVYFELKEWQERRERIEPKICSTCPATANLQLHHKKYPPLGAPLQAFIDQPDSDFAWLCSACHAAITDSMRTRRQTRRKGKGK